MKKNPARSQDQAGLFTNERTDSVRVSGPVHRSSGLVTERNLYVRSVDFKSRPPHAYFECSLYYQVSFDWTTSFLSDAPIIKRGLKTVKRFVLLRIVNMEFRRRP